LTSARRRYTPHRNFRIAAITATLPACSSEVRAMKRSPSAGTRNAAAARACRTIIGGGKNHIAGGMIFHAGRRPLYQSGKIVGGLGISGDTSCTYSLVDGASVFTHLLCLMAGLDTQPIVSLSQITGRKPVGARARVSPASKSVRAKSAHEHFSKSTICDSSNSTPSAEQSRTLRIL